MTNPQQGRLPPNRSIWSRYCRSAPKEWGGDVLDYEWFDVDVRCLRVETGGLYVICKAS